MAPTVNNTSINNSIPSKAEDDHNKRGYKLAEVGPQNLSMAGIANPLPTFDDPYKKRQWMLEHMAGAFRVFGRKGYAEGSAGHISIRDPVRPDTFWINPLGKHFSMMKASDMVHVDEDGNIIGGNVVPINAAGFRIHSALHKARPDVNAACHTHSLYGKAYSAFGKPIEMINQDACSFFNVQSVYQDFGGVVLESEEGEKIAKALGPKNKVLIMQNHGLLTTGETVDEAAYLFTLLENTCKAQLLVDAAAVSNKSLKKFYISDTDAQYTFHMVADPVSMYSEFQPDFQYEEYMCNGDFKK